MPLIIFSFFLLAFFSCLSAEQLLTLQQWEFFQSQGYLVIENFMEDRTLDGLRNRAHTLVSQCDFDTLASVYEASHGEISWENYYFNQGQPICYFFEAQAFQKGCTLTKHQYIKKISYALHTRDDYFKSFSYDNKIQRLLLELGIEDPVLVQSMYLFKQPFIGSEVLCHQDSSFIHAEPDTLIALWFAMEDATTENGCLWVQGGGHLEPLKFKMIKNTEGKIAYEIFDESPWELEKMLPLEVKKGTVVIMHGHLPHRSDANHSSCSREAYSLHAISNKSKYLPTNWH